MLLIHFEYFKGLALLLLELLLNNSKSNFMKIFFITNLIAFSENFFEYLKHFESRE